MTLHDLITLMILLIGTLGCNEIQYIRYTSEYIPKLQLHQHKVLEFLTMFTLYLRFIKYLYTWMTGILVLTSTNNICSSVDVSFSRKNSSSTYMIRSPPSSPMDYK